MNKIKVMLYGVDKEPMEIEVDNTLESLQNLVGGYIECVPLGLDLILVCNEEGKVMEIEPNRYVKLTNGKIVDVIMGDFFVVKGNGEDFESITDDDIENIYNCCGYPEE